MALLPRFEHRSEPIAPWHLFVRRLARSGVVALGLIAASLLVGMLGYHSTASLSWSDSFLNAAMLLGGMGPLDSPTTLAGKLFAGLYALYCGLAVILVTGIILAPLVHRMMHKFHVEGGGQ